MAYVTAETFANEFILSIQKKTGHQFKNRYRSVDVLLIDDIHFLEGKEGTQEELFHTFNALYDANKQMVFTCDRPVSEIRSLSDRLRSRFERGLNVDLQPPNYETRIAILKKKIEEKKVKIPDEVVDLICRNITTNVRDLEKALTKLIAYAELVNKHITLEIAQQQLKDFFTQPAQKNITIEHIQRVVADYFGLSYKDLRGKRRTKAVAFPRQVAMYISRELTEYSTTEVGSRVRRPRPYHGHARLPEDRGPAEAGPQPRAHAAAADQEGERDTMCEPWGLPVGNVPPAVIDVGTVSWETLGWSTAAGGMWTDGEQSGALVPGRYVLPRERHAAVVHISTVPTGTTGSLVY